MKKYALVMFLVAHCGSYIAAGEVGQLLSDLSKYPIYTGLKGVLEKSIWRAENPRIITQANADADGAVACFLRFLTNDGVSFEDVEPIMPQVLSDIDRNAAYVTLWNSIEDFKVEASRGYDVTDIESGLVVSGFTPYMLAARDNEMNIVRFLASIKISPNIFTNEGASPLWHASESGHEEVVQILVASDADVNKVAQRVQKRTALHQASQNGHTNVVRQLLQAGATTDVKDARGYHPLHLAAENGHIDVVSALLESGVDPFVLSTAGETPLMRSFLRGNIATRRLLLFDNDKKRDNCEKHVNHRAVGFDNNTVLHLACQDGDEEMVDLLISVGAEVDVINDARVSPLWLAAAKGHTGVVDKLLECGAAVNVPAGISLLRETPLHMACQNGHIAVVRALIRAEAFLSPLDGRGNTPLSNAIIFKHEEIADVLRRAGAV